ncbi:MAG: amidohydrolase family protein [Novosphingobium sp.]|nr:amidohydrolase family protein [Novosphingobium sp.]
MDYGLFDADQHYYEAEDCLTRYASKRMQAMKSVRWLTEGDGKRRRLVIADKLTTVIGNPTFDPIARPGAFHETLKKLQAGEDRTTTAAAYGELVPIDPCYRDRDVRLKRMDEQGVERALLFPTLGVTLEGYADHDPELLYDLMHAFNLWLEDDWGFAYRDRIYAVPYIPMMDVERSVAELESLLDRGARAITLRPGPAYGRSPADPYFDPFWARVNEAGVLVTFHAYEGPSLQSRAFRDLWAAPSQGQRMEDIILERAIASSDVQAMETFVALVLHNLFGRFPKIRVAAVELGSGWVPFALSRLDHAGGLLSRQIKAFGTTLGDLPSEIFKRHVWVSPWPEEDVPGLTGLIGVDRVIMGSDWPHAEGNVQPGDYASGLASLDDASKRRIMRENALDLVLQ